MKTVELVIKEKKATTFINFLKQLDFVEVKNITKSKKVVTKQPVSNNIIPATTPNADISKLFGTWKNVNVDEQSIRNTSRRKDQLAW
ncbi:MAG: hypothetical protein QM541_04240 [Flavobacterium sp.]|nr:hypothetical protein [Flavobacterium sp.]